MRHYGMLWAALLFGSSAALAQANLGDQIGAVNAAVSQQKQDEAEAEAAREEEYRQQQLAQQLAAAQQARAAAAALAQEQARQDRIAAARQAREAKDEAYQDQLIELDLQQKKLQLQAQQTQVNRENEVIDQQLKRQSAETDLVQSKADANRNISQGQKTLLQDTGTAEVKKASGWVN
jgi:ATPase subunit of ABC transporter with duplicated ATPase domains